LQIEYPKNIHLLRGNHEAADINALFGFRLECVERLGVQLRMSRWRARGLTRTHACVRCTGEEGGLWAWERFNTVFNMMPLAAVIEKRVICMHGASHV
jgi:protein phosphatase